MSFWDDITSYVSQAAPSGIAGPGFGTAIQIGTGAKASWDKAQSDAQVIEAINRTTETMKNQYPNLSGADLQAKVKEALDSAGLQYDIVDAAAPSASASADTSSGTPTSGTPTTVSSDPNIQNKVAGLVGSSAPMGVSGDSSADAAVAVWQGMSEEDRINAKQYLYYAGLYGSAKPFPSSTLTQDDIDAMGKAATLQQYNGTSDWQSAISQQYQLGVQQGVPFGQAPGEDDATQAYGQAASALQQFADSNGITLTDQYIKNNASAIANGTATLDDTLAGLRTNYVAQAYPAWAKQIEAGQDVSDLAQPYLQTMQSMLELPPDGVSLSDKAVQKALSAVDEKGNPTYMPLWQFKDQLRQDPRWASTDNAWDEVGGQMAGLADKLGI